MNITKETYNSLKEMLSSENEWLLAKNMIQNQWGKENLLKNKYNRILLLALYAYFYNIGKYKVALELKNILRQRIPKKLFEKMVLKKWSESKHLTINKKEEDFLQEISFDFKEN